MTQRIPLTIAERIDWLFTNIRHPDGREYTYQEVEEGTRRAGHPVVSTYVWKLRKGKANNPGWLILRGLSRFFNIPITYFYDENLNFDKLEQIRYDAFSGRAASEGVALRPAARSFEDAEVQEIAEEVRRLDGPGRTLVLNLLRFIQGKGKDDVEKPPR